MSLSPSLPSLIRNVLFLALLTSPLRTDLASHNPLRSALATARHIQNLDQVQYPEGVKSPKPELNTNAKDGKFRYDRDFLMQFMSVCKEGPDNHPSLEAIGLEPSDQAHSMGRGGSGRRGVSGGMGPPSSNVARQASVGLGLGSLNGFGKSASGFATTGNFSAPGKLSSEERFMRSTSMGSPPGGPHGRPLRTRSKHGEARNDANRISAAQAQFSAAHAANVMALEPVAPLEATANRWVPVSASRKPVAVDMDAPEVVDRKVRSLLNKLTMEKFESISNQIIQWANKSESEKDGHTLIQAIRLVLEKGTDEATWSEMYARLCRKMMEQISPDVQDDGIRNSEGKPITGGLLFHKYLLNRCQEDFEHGWKQKESTAAAAAEKANEDQALKVESEKEENKESGETPQFSEEYYSAQKAKRQGLGLVKFIGELFKLQMLTERIMHECIKKLLSNVNNPEEEEIESLCKLLSTVGQSLDTSKARGHMDVYLSRMKELAKSSSVSSRMQFMLLDTIELRERKWNTRIAVPAPTTIAQIHEAAAKEKIQQDKDSLARSAGMSRGGSRRGHDRDNSQVGPDGWTVAPGPSRPANKAGDLSGFGKIAKSGGPMTFGPSSVFSAKSKDGKPRESSQPPRTSSNMFSMLGAESTAEVSAPSQSSRPSRPPSRNASVDLSHGAPVEPTQRPRLNLLPRSKPLAEKGEESPTPQPEDREGVEGEIREKAEPSISKEQSEKKIDQDRKEFFAIRNLDEAEDYFTALPAEHRHLLVEKLVMSAIESKEADARLVGDLFERAISRNLCSPRMQFMLLDTIEL
ncbi:ARM repeat-containing protein [Phellopilus nigrolimitatus]|nr:ARM repeat-containing protein [Phellopilus nigrolimitatus]